MDSLLDISWLCLTLSRCSFSLQPRAQGLSRWPKIRETILVGALLQFLDPPRKNFLGPFFWFWDVFLPPSPARSLALGDQMPEILCGLQGRDSPDLRSRDIRPRETSCLVVSRTPIYLVLAVNKLRTSWWIQCLTVWSTIFFFTHSPFSRCWIQLLREWIHVNPYA